MNTDDGPKLVELNVATSLGGLGTCAPYAAATRRSAYALLLRECGLYMDSPDTSRVWLDVFGSLVEWHGEGPLHIFEECAAGLLSPQECEPVAWHVPETFRLRPKRRVPSAGVELPGVELPCVESSAREVVLAPLVFGGSLRRDVPPAGAAQDEASDQRDQWLGGGRDVLSPGLTARPSRRPAARRAAGSGSVNAADDMGLGLVVVRARKA
ncbi:hypothetical protein [Streptomyces sp. NPDC002851]